MRRLRLTQNVIKQHYAIAQLVGGGSENARRSLTDGEQNGRRSLADFVVSGDLDLVDGGGVEVVDVQLRHAVVDPHVLTKTRLVRTQINLRGVRLFNVEVAYEH